MLSRAEKYVYICTPYLVIDNELMNALTSAAKSGIDVRMITPGVPDKWYVHMVTRSYYAPLLRAGVRVYEYIPGFIHSKTMVCDDASASAAPSTWTTAASSSTTSVPSGCSAPQL